ncbi:hypothetical protein M3P19_06920 [Muricauda sp. 2012CJ35-5]|uniref:Uncharacterized protein n=1 Tax=Flagellimonas spongiicola TaxID=2942208 RepID=A0ABT0PQQ9_9FLAO|nr:DUF6702 family protein [Allomuricauda spongiicola]MCL6273732.1 hypothetical protein [Allomuricauda spongiicola]
MIRLFFVLIALGIAKPVIAHPLRLSLCEIEYHSNKKLLSINLKLFLTDVNEAIVFDPYSKELAFCQPNESANADQLLLEYLNRFFHVKINGKLVDLKVKRKKLSGEGDNTALWVYFEYRQDAPLSTMEIKNAVFTDLFFDQNNIVYVHVNGESKSLMLNKKTAVHQLKY